MENGLPIWEVVEESDIVLRSVSLRDSNSVSSCRAW